MAELMDFRGRITTETHQVLEAISRAKACDKQEIVRDVLHEWALSKIDEAILIARLTRREGNDLVKSGG